MIAYVIEVFDRFFAESRTGARPSGDPAAWPARRQPEGEAPDSSDLPQRVSLA